MTSLTMPPPPKGWPEFRGYAALIVEATGERDRDLVEEIEQCMRLVTGGVLDSISRRTFINLARGSVAPARILLADRKTIEGSLV
jgi:hypothetical protein